MVEFQIDVFEPHPVPGAGPIYDPDQPEYLLMNFAGEHVDMWSPASRAVPVAERRSYVEWSGTDPGDYPSRADVGRYLADGFDRLLRHAPVNVSARRRQVAVAAVSTQASVWAVTAGGDTDLYDEVLIATGHESAWEGGLASAWDHAVPLIPSVFPVHQWLSRAQVAPGSTLAVRGFALTFIDAALALTEGRGGMFERLDHPYRLRYVASDDDVARIYPYSRTGRPMLAKPGRELAAAVPELGTIAESGRFQILALEERADVTAGLGPILAETAAAALRAAGGDPHMPPEDLGPVGEVERSLAVGVGLARPDMTWALGQAWRELYPAIVARFSGRSWAPGEAIRFRRMSAEMERLAFGPPPVNAAKMLALIDAGRVNLDHLREPRLETVDAVIDAVLAPPGARGLQSPLLERLVRDGHARMAPGARGIEVTADARCIGRSGSPTPGLSVIGRPTEDSVIGNDTLNRALHPYADRWARRVVRRSATDRTPAIARQEAT